MTPFDAVSALGGGQEMLENVTKAFGRIQARGKLTMREMISFAGAGIPAWQFLVEAIGTSIPNAMEMARKGMISSGDAINAILAGMNRRYKGMMARQAATMRGMRDQIRDASETIARGFGQDIIRIFRIDKAMQRLVESTSRPADLVMEGRFINALKRRFPCGTQPVSHGYRRSHRGRSGACDYCGADSGACKLKVALWATLLPLLPFIKIGVAVGLAIWALGRIAGVFG